MRILMVSDVYFPRVNGVSTSIRTLRAALEASGHETTLIAPDYPNAAPERRLLRVAGWPIPFDPEDRLMYPKRLAETLATFGANDIDVLHIHTPFLAHRAGVRWARRIGVPSVETYHTLFEEYFHHYLPVFPKPWLAAAARRISRKECDGVNAVIAPSQAMKTALEGYGVTRPIHIIPTGLPDADFAPGDGAAFRAAHGIDAARPVMLYVGRVAFEKNLEFLLDVAVAVRKHVPEQLFVIAGEGPALARLKKQVLARNLGDNVMFVGYLDRKTELPACYRAADVFVFASKTETQGLVLLEAMALGVPVVALAAMGTCDVLREGSGCRIAPDDVSGFAAVLAPLLANRAAAQMLGERGRDYAQGWRDTVMAESVGGLYAQLAAMSTQSG